MRCGTKLCHCELMNGSKPRAGAAPLPLPQVNSATIPIPPGLLCVYSYPSPFSPAWPSGSASPPPRSAPSLCLTSSGRLALSGHHPSRTAPKTQPSNAQFSFDLSSPPHRSKLKIETALGFMQQEPAPAGSLEPKQDSALPHTPTMPHPESLSEDHQPSPGHSLTEVRLGLGRWGLGFVDLLWWRER